MHMFLIGNEMCVEMCFAAAIKNTLAKMCLYTFNLKPMPSARLTALGNKVLCAQISYAMGSVTASILTLILFRTAQLKLLTRVPVAW